MNQKGNRFFLLTLWNSSPMANDNMRAQNGFPKCFPICTCVKHFVRCKTCIVYTKKKVSQSYPKPSFLWHSVIFHAQIFFSIFPNFQGPSDLSKSPFLASLGTKRTQLFQEWTLIKFKHGSLGQFL